MTDIDFNLLPRHEDRVCFEGLLDRFAQFIIDCPVILRGCPHVHDDLHIVGFEIIDVNLRRRVLQHKRIGLCYFEQRLSGFRKSLVIQQ